MSEDLFLLLTEKGCNTVRHSQYDKDLKKNITAAPHKYCQHHQVQCPLKE